MSKSTDRQLADWVEGHPWHDHENGWCCPDFSCCHSPLLGDRQSRERYAAAYRAGDDRTVMAFWAMWLTAAMNARGIDAEVVNEALEGNQGSA